jgi:ChrR-like protein with cupin domain
MKLIQPISLALLLTSSLAAQTPPPAPGPGQATLYSPATLEWKDGPASLPKGVRMATLEGNPAEPGPFTLRFRFPDGFRVNPHWHTETEHATVISGILHLGMGDKFDRESTHALGAGAFGHWPAGMRHYAWFEGETILQVHGQGPWTVTYVNPSDDPRKTPD